MDNKRDQVQAHMFMMGRLTSGMLRTDPDAPESPQGRTNRAIMLGLLLGAVIAAGAFVLGLIAPGGGTDSWRKDGTVVVEKETGSRFLYLNGRLRTLRNYTSAKLLLGADLTVETVKTSALADTPHGAPVGIPGAPEQLPPTDKLSRDPWQLCSSTPSAEDTGQADSDTGPVTTLAVAGQPMDEPLNSRQGLFVKGPDEQEYLLWKGSRLRLDQENGAPEALGYGSLTPARVSGALLSALPAGPDLAPKTLDDLGADGPDLAGLPTRVGQLFRVAVPGGSTKTYQLQEDGLAQLTATQAALALGDPRIREDAYEGKPPQAIDIGSNVLKGHLAPGNSTANPGSMPSSPPEAMTPPAQRHACVQVNPTAKGPSTTVGLVPPSDLGTVAQPSREGLTKACLPVGRVTVPPSRGVLVRALGAAGGKKMGTTLYLVTDTGVKHRVTSQEAAEALGYSNASPQGLPSLLLSMLPSGPDLSTTAAEQGRATNTAPRCEEQSPEVSESDDPSTPTDPSAPARPE